MIAVRVYITLKPSLLDSAGRAVGASLNQLGFEEVADVRCGKMIEIQVKEYNEDRIKAMCDQLLANPVIEDYRFEAVEAAIASR